MVVGTLICRMSTGLTLLCVRVQVELAAGWVVLAMGAGQARVEKLFMRVTES